MLCNVSLLTFPQTPQTEWTKAYSATAAYLVVFALLYQWMQRRKQPFRLNHVLLVYNFICVILAGAVCILLAMNWPVRQGIDGKSTEDEHYGNKWRGSYIL